MSRPSGSRGKVTAVVGAQYGSEGKGAIVAHLAHDYGIHVRTGGPNAGHTFYAGGKTHVMQSVPCGWINPLADVYIGRGALVEPAKLAEELDHIEAFMPGARARVRVDAFAGVISEAHYAEEGGIKGDIHKRFGSTGKGVGASRRDRMSRLIENFTFMHEIAQEFGFEDLIVEDTAAEIYSGAIDGYDVLLEGAQGSGLSLIHGTWPYVTSNDTNAASLAADAGMPPQWVSDVILVARTMPIRVAGNSGPLHDETDWDSLSCRLGRSVTEKTTVTKLTRRIGSWDPSLFDKSVRLNGATQVALTFLDYLGDGSDYGVRSMDKLSQSTLDFITDIELVHRVYVRWLKTGPTAAMIIDRGEKGETKCAM